MFEPHKTEKVTLYNADCLEVLKTFADNSIDAMVTDPPAGISFMGKDWDDYRRKYNDNDVARKNVFGRTSRVGPEYGRARDGFIAAVIPIFEECFRVLKPGSHALVWSIPRTSHWTAFALEEAGFEVRDKIAHIFSTGFPKSANISKMIDRIHGLEQEVVGVKPGHEEFVGRKTKGHLEFKDGTEGFDRPWMHDDVAREKYHMQTKPASEEAQQWDGWGTALKPAREDWLLVRKSLGEKTIAENILKWGTGGLNIDGCRIGTNPGYKYRADKNGTIFHGEQGNRIKRSAEKNGSEFIESIHGRFPANIIHDGSEDVLALFPMQKSGLMQAGQCRKKTKDGGGYHGHMPDIATEAGTYGDSGSAARFFYCAKASASERNTGLDTKEEEKVNDGKQTSIDNPFQRGETLRKNTHPTVKPIALCRYLCKLITPPNGTVLDPFMGSGSIGISALQENFSYIGIEKEPEYFEIAKKRIEFEEKQPKQNKLF